ncbi:MAG: hypothetical protein JXA01_01955 [Dehalococcoidia bacterium]|nr:hypothetical protein [Dehalococcoidia bacterium]
MAMINVKFNGIWKLYLGMDRAVIEAADLDSTFLRIEKKFAIIIEKKLKERGVKLKGSVLDYSYITINGKNAKTIKERVVQDGDVLNLYIAVPGG